LHGQLSAIESIEQVEKSIHKFISYSNQFAPHFAYGELTKAEYATAHVLHIKNHLEEIKMGAVS
jgi:hypothetical protein